MIRRMVDRMLQVELSQAAQVNFSVVLTLTLVNSKGLNTKTRGAGTSFFLRNRHFAANLCQDGGELGICL